MIGVKKNNNLSKSANKLNRKKILRQAISVYTERKEDAFKFGLKQNNPIITNLDLALIKNISRLSYYQDKRIIINSLFKNPKITTIAVLSELLRDLRRR